MANNFFLRLKITKLVAKYKRKLRCLPFSVKNMPVLKNAKFVKDLSIKIEQQG